MDEELMNKTTEEKNEVPSAEIISTDVNIDDEEYDISMVETESVIEVISPEVIDIEVDEAMGWVGGDSERHYNLLGRNDPNQHEIEAITGLREELDEIERLKTVCSDKFNVANYYEWNDAAYDEYGYFVGVVPGTSKIQICDGSNIFGVSVNDAGFIGGQDSVKRNNTYGLVVTSGLVDVRCELDVNVGDYVVSNTHGYAQKAESSYGYRVIARENKHGVEYAVIMLGVQADVTNLLGKRINETKDQVDVNYKNIISAVNMANQAYNKAMSVEQSNNTMSDKVGDVVNKVENAITNVEDLEAQVSQSVTVSAQAKAIAEMATTSALSVKQEVADLDKNTAAKIGELTKTLEPLTTWEDPDTGNTGASYLVNYIDNGLATKADIERVDDDLNTSHLAILKNAKTLNSMVVSIDKYSVGEYSTAYGLTLEQATGILECDMIYVPTKSHTEEYPYVDGDTTYNNEREFTSGYLYRWGERPDGLFGWITVDRDYSRDKLNTSAPAVYFYTEAPAVLGEFGYWYTDGAVVADGYEPYTLYKWEEDGWFAVATLAGNTQVRSISHILQTANSIETSLSNVKSDAATSKQWIDNNSTNIQDVVTWKADNQEAIATTMQQASDAGAYIAQIASVKNDDGTIDAIASIVTAVNESESSVGINADRIVMTGTTTFLKPEDVGDDGATVISGSRITTGELDAEKVKVINLQASNIIVTGSGGNTTVDEAIANTLVSSTIYYALSTSTTTPPPDGDWDLVAPEKERKKYMWQKTVNVYGDGSSEERVVCIAGADGEGAIVVNITSSAGTIYINNDIQTTLIAQAYQDNQDITDEFPDGAFLWEKYDMYGVKDDVWSYTGKTIQVNNLDIYKRAMFNCVLDVEQRIEKEDVE